MTKHTPDIDLVSDFPWYTEQWQIRSKNGSVVAKICPWDTSGCRKEDIANAYVIEKSPEIYEQLKYALECIECGIIPNKKWVIKTRKLLFDED